MGTKTWTVVSFQIDNTLADVATTWIIVTDECVWPPFTADKVAAALKNHHPLNTCWPTFKIRIFRNATYGDYALARQKCIKAEGTSDVGTIDGEEQHRPVRKTRRVLSSSDEDNGCTLLKTPPNLKKNKRFSSNKRGQIDDLPPLDISQSPSVTLGQLVGTSELNTSTPVSTPMAGKTNCSQCDENSEYIKEMLRQQYIIKNMVTDLSLEVRGLKKPVSQQNISPEDSLFRKLELPSDSPAGLEKLNQYLENEENFKNAVTEISQIGGKDTYDLIRRVMCKLLINGLAAQYSWLGRREKLSFYTLKVAKLVIEAALRLEKGDQKAIEENISSWLRRSTVRAKFFKKKELIRICKHFLFLNFFPVFGF